MHHDIDRAFVLVWIIRNSNGSLWLRIWKISRSIWITPKETECTILLWTMHAVHLGTYKVIEFKGDNTNINRFVNENITTPQLHHDLETIWPWSQMFSLKKFSFRHQEQNLCANLLARKSISSPTNWRLYHSCPRFLTTFLNNDIGYED